MSTLSKTRILVLGASGMLGQTIFKYFSAFDSYDTFGTLRSPAKYRFFPKIDQERILTNVDARNDDDLIRVFEDLQPDLVINCIGIIKQLDAAKNHLTSLAINACLPHRLAQYCLTANARLVHLSTDCVFSGRSGMYDEDCFADADDLYGRTKLLGEVDYPHAITLRTSIIGHELTSTHSLVDWFLAQEGPIQGYSSAIFSGLPTIEIARVIHQHVLPNPDLRGLYHLSVDPINKFDLLTHVAQIYGKKIDIIPNDQLVIDRSLNSERFRAATGFRPPKWPELIERMHESYLRMNRNKNV